MRREEVQISSLKRAVPVDGLRRSRVRSEGRTRSAAPTTIVSPIAAPSAQRRLRRLTNRSEAEASPSQAPRDSDRAIARAVTPKHPQASRGCAAGRRADGVTEASAPPPGDGPEGGR